MDQNQTELNPLKNIEGAIEAILFAAGYPVKYEKIAEVLGCSVEDLYRDHSTDKEECPCREEAGACTQGTGELPV